MSYTQKKTENDSVNWIVVDRLGKKFDLGRDVNGDDKNNFQSYREADAALNRLGLALGAVFPVRA